MQIQTGSLILTNQNDKPDKDKPIVKSQKMGQRENEREKSKGIEKVNGVKQSKSAPPPKSKSPKRKQSHQSPMFEVVPENVPEIVPEPSPTPIPSNSPYSSALICSIKGCLKSYPTASSLHHHETLKHRTPAQDWNTHRIYNIEIKENGQTRRNYRH